MEENNYLLGMIAASTYFYYVGTKKTHLEPESKAGLALGSLLASIIWPFTLPMALVEDFSTPDKRPDW